MPRLRRLAPAQGEPLCKDRRAEHSRTGTHDRRRTHRLLRHAAVGCTRRGDSQTHPRRDTQPSGIPVGRGFGIPDVRPSLVDALGRREPAHKPLHIAGQQPCRLALHTRRAEHRPAPARHAPPDKGSQTAARSGQYGNRGGARGGDHPRRRLHSRRRPACRRAWRRDRLQRPHQTARHGRKEPHGRLPRRPPPHRTSGKGARLEQLDSNTRRPGE